MINHISIGVHNPEKVSAVLAEIWNGMVLPFPPAGPGSFIVLANDGKGSGVEVTPINTVMVPGTGLPPEGNFDSDVITEEFGAQFVSSDFSPRYVATHLNISTDLGIDEILEIGKREGWRTLLCNRDRGLFQLIELWVEDRFMIEVMTPEMTARYVEITSPEFIAKVFGGFVPPAGTEVAALDLVA